MKRTNRRYYIDNIANNQIVLAAPEGKYFISYGLMIVFVDAKGNTFLDQRYWKYSTITSKYRRKFLMETTDESEKRIRTGEYKLVNLNDQT